MDRDAPLVPIPSSLDYVTQAKLTLMRGITAHIRARYATMAQASRSLDMDAEVLSRIACDRFERFSLHSLVMTCERLGVRITITIE